MMGSGLLLRIYFLESKLKKYQNKKIGVFSQNIISSLNIDHNVLPVSNSLDQNYPKPFNPLTTINYDLPNRSIVNLVIYDIMGREIKQLLNLTQEAGYHSIIWDGQTSLGKNAGAGVYLYMIQANDFRQVRKMLLLK